MTWPKKKKKKKIQNLKNLRNKVTTWERIKVREKVVSENTELEGIRVNTDGAQEN